MPSERLRQIAQEILNAFENGSVPKALAVVFLYRHVNFPSRRWSWRNQLIASLRRHPDARGFRQWQQVGRQVRKGEQAFYILGPCTGRAKEDDPDRGIEAGDPILFGFKAIPVFGYTQTEGESLPEHLEAERRLPQLPLIEVAHAWGIRVTVEPTQLYGVLGTYVGDTIRLGTSNLNTWAHELVHAADDRLGTLQGTSKLSREVVAEFGATTLLELLGHTVESDRGGAYRYITAYAQDQELSAFEACSQFLDRTCRCIDLILATAEQLNDSIPPAALAPPAPLLEANAAVALEEAC